MASLADYEAAYALAGEVLRETLSDLKRPLREALQRVQALAAKGEGSVVAARDPRGAARAGLDRAAAGCSELVELEYLAVAEAGGEGAGKATRYRVIDRGAAGTSWCSGS